MSPSLHLALLSWQLPRLRWEHYTILLRACERLNGNGHEALIEAAAWLAANASEGVAGLSWTSFKQFLDQSPWLRRNLEVEKWCREQNVELLHPAHGDYPRPYLALEEPPLALTLKGHPVWTVHNCLAVVGSREPLACSLEWMECELGAFLKQRDFATVSGGARGIDQKCHALSLRHRRPTVVMVPSGLAQLYPPTLSRWVDPVLDSGGALVSAFHPMQAMRKSHFERRNQLLAQLGEGLLIVEAARRSGTAMTARLASEREKPIGVVPGHPLQRQFQGSLDVLASGAHWIRDRADLEAVFASVPRFAQTPKGSHGENQVGNP